jgi:hypothetical protein
MYATTLLYLQIAAACMLLWLIGGHFRLLRHLPPGPNRRSVNELITFYLILGIMLLGPWGSWNRFVIPAAAIILALVIWLQFPLGIPLMSRAAILVETVLLGLALTIAVGRLLIV